MAGKQYGNVLNNQKQIKMKKIKLWLYNFFQEIIEDEVTHGIEMKVNGELVCGCSMYYVPRVGDKIKFTTYNVEKIFKVLEVVSETAGAFITLHGVLVQVDNKRGFATYLTNNKFECISGSVVSDITGTALIEDKNKNLMHVRGEYVKAIENLPALVQIAEMYHDSMLGRCEEGLPFEIVSQTLKNLQNER